MYKSPSHIKNTPLSDDDIRDIRRDYKSKARSTAQMADYYDRSHETIARIGRGETYRHVPVDNRTELEIEKDSAKSLEMLQEKLAKKETVVEHSPELKKRLAVLRGEEEIPDPFGDE